MYYGWRTIEGTNNGENAKYTFKPTPFNNLTEGTNYDVYCASKGQTPKVLGALSAPHTPNPWGHVELVSKDVGIG